MQRGVTKRVWIGGLAGLMVGLAPGMAWAQDAALDPKFLSQLLDLGKLSTILFVIVVAVIATRMSNAAFDSLGERFRNRRLLLKKVASLTRFGIYIVTAVVIVQGVLKPEHSTLLALGTALALTIGLALKDLISSIIAGVIILLDSPFQVGDRVQYDATYGEVVEIGLRTVKINTLDDNLVSIPNNKFLTDVVASSNAGALDMMVQLDFFIGVSADHDLARRLVFEATATSRFVFLEKPVTVLVEDAEVAGFYATRIRSKFYVADTSYESAIRSDVASRVKRQFRAYRISPPYAIEHSIDHLERSPDASS